METINLKILESPPDLSVKAKLIIEPLAPLSMVSDLPGSFYKSLNRPSKKMLCGLFENILGWHIDIADRKEIQKDLVKVRQQGIKDKEEKKAIKTKIESYQQGSTYIPLLMEYFDIDLVTLPPMMHYNDLWSRAYRRADTVKHLGGTRYMDASHIKKWNHYNHLISIKLDRLKSNLEDVKGNDERTKKLKTKIKNTEDIKEKLFKRYLGKFAKFYSSPTSRELIEMKSRIEFITSINIELLDLLKISIEKNNYLYLGNSEGWINLKIDKL
jgi:CRISPR-associated protein Cas5